MALPLPSQARSSIHSILKDNKHNDILVMFLMTPLYIIDIMK